MYWSLTNLRNYRVHAIDGQIGALHDILFDDREWVVRYLVVDTEVWLPGPKILISPLAVGRTAFITHQVRMLLTRDQIKDAPSAGADSSISRQEEARLAEYYDWPTYWAPPGRVATPAHVQHQPGEQARETRIGSGNDGPHLRSVREVVGYRIETHDDGAIGHVEDLIGHDTDWAIRYLVVDTRYWLPGKRVIVPPTWVEDIHWKQARLRVDLRKGQIEDAPAYDPAMPIRREYEKQVYDFYGRPAYWCGPQTDTEDRRRTSE